MIKKFINKIKQIYNYMKRSLLTELPMYYILGFILYKITMYVTKTVLLKILGLEKKDIIIFMDGFQYDIVIYSKMYIIIMLIFYFIPKIISKIKNRK